MTLSSSEAVFRHFADRFGLDKDGDVSAFALFAYALVERDRIEWIEHKMAMDGIAPSGEKVAAWFGDKPSGYFEEKSRVAVTWLTNSARLMLSDEIEQAKHRAITETVGNLGRFWPGFWVGNLVGITSNIAFAFLVVLFVAVIDTDFSFVAWARKLFGFH